jgi:hypothetical protein
VTIGRLPSLVMSDQHIDSKVPPLEETPGPKLPWEIPEVAGTSILGAIGCLVVGGLATGIARGIEIEQPFTGVQGTWNVIAFSTQWASPVVALFVLCVFGLCWWQLQAWSEVAEESDEDDEGYEAQRHMRRAHQLACGARIALFLTAAGSLAGFVAELGVDLGAVGWTIEIDAGAATLATLVLSLAGEFAGRRLRQLYSPGLGAISGGDNL